MQSLPDQHPDDRFANLQHALSLKAAASATGWKQHALRIRRTVMAQRPPAALAYLLAVRLHFIGQSAHDHLLTDPDAHGVVYAAFALPANRRASKRPRTAEITHIPVYVGHTALAAHERLKRHVYDAGYAYEHRIGLARPFLRFIQTINISRLLIIPLELISIPGEVGHVTSNTKSAEWHSFALHREMVWAQRLCSLRPIYGSNSGYNAQLEVNSMAATDFIYGDHICPLRRRWFASRNIHRRLLYLQSLHATNYFTTAASVDAHFQPFRLPTLHRLYSAITACPPTALGLDPIFQSWLITPLSKALNDRLIKPGKPDLNIKLWLPHALRQLLPTTAIYSIFRQTDLHNLLPINSFSPAIHWQAGPTNHQLLCTYPQIAQTLTSAQYTALINRPCACHHFPDLQHPTLGHVLTTCPYPVFPDAHRPALTTLWNHGARYRPHLPPPPTSEVLAAAHTCALTSTYHCERQHGLARGTLTPWAGTFIEYLTTAVAAHSTTFKFPWPVYSTDTLAAFRTHTSNFVVTVTDKSSSTLQLVCRKYYAQKCMQDLYAPGPVPNFPTVLQTDPQRPASTDAAATDNTSAATNANHEPPPPPPPSSSPYYRPCSSAYMRSLLTYHNSLLAKWAISYHHSPATPVDSSNTDTFIPAYYAATVKMHKQPPAMRYLACSHRCSSTDISDLTTAILRAASAAFISLWTHTLPSFPPWYCLSSSAAINIVHTFNARQLPLPLLPAQAYDFTRLYTNIPHDQLRTTISTLVATAISHVFVNESQPVWPFIIVRTTIYPHDLNKKPHHKVTFTTAPTLHPYRRVGNVITRCFSLTDFDTLFSTLLSSTFIKFGPARVQQMCGVPMGISAAPFIANLFLAWFEYQFLRQSLIPNLSLAAQAILDAFRFSGRFLDDLLSLHNPHLATLMYNNLSYLDLHGIYPPTLRVEPQHHIHLLHQEMPFLDILLIPDTSGTSCRLITRLYDKRVQPAFINIRLSRFVHLSSNVNDSCKRNILTSQLNRLSRVITDPPNFCLEVALVIHALRTQAYPIQRLLQQTRAFIIANPFLYHHARTNHPRLDIFATIKLHL